ncbi:MAG: hypothetical protein SVX43_01280, partial [Cyanobacteriota bacterium]|nr:hypothetical protein [Cyanobacteriota bacterium]
MTLNIKHFDCRLNQWLDDPSHESGILTEKLENTLLEEFFPEGSDRFSFGHIDEYSSPEELKNHPNGDVLLLASGTRLLYGSPEYLTKIEEICPDPKDRGAYGSIFLGSCKESVKQNLNVLVVDDEGIAREDENGNPTGEWEVEPGENGGILPKEEAFKLVGDCHGKIAPELAQTLGGGKTNKVIQHRLRFGEARFGKGTVAPWDLENLPFTDAENRPKIDTLLPLSSFKGGDKKNSPMQPGLYKNVPIWMGQKDMSPDPNKSKTAISQVLASAPEGIRDFLEEIEIHALELRENQNDPRQLAQKYVEDYENRKAIQSENSEDTEETEQEQPEEQFMYRLIKADLESGHLQLLETQKVQNELQRFLQNKWRDIATGKSLKFNRGMIISSKNLKEGEICDTRFLEGEELLNFRSPYLNSNGMCVNINKYVPEAYNADGEALEGVIAVSDETLNRIAERYRNQGITEPLPAETESQRQGRDFDGDTMGVELASKYPNFTDEIKRRNAPGNAYAPTQKEKKISFTNEDGTSWDFPDIAHFMSDGISVGRINNFVTAVEALESEGEFLKNRATPQQKQKYIQEIASHYAKLIKQDEGENDDFLPEQFRDRMTEIVQIAQQPQITESELDRAFDLNRSIYRNLIEEGCYQNQIAVDMFKSARAPDTALIQEYEKLLYRPVEYIKDKKDKNVYTSRNNQPRVIKTNGFSPVELVIDQTNEIWQESSLETRPTVQFRNLFDETYSPQQKKLAEQQKSEFDNLFSRAATASRALEEEKGPNLSVVTRKGREIQMSNVLKSQHPALFPEKSTGGVPPPLQLEEMRLEENRGRTSHRLVAKALDAEGNWKIFGTVCENSRLEHNLQAGGKAEIAEYSLQPGFDKRAVKLQFNQAFEKLEEWTNSINPDERLQFAAAAWHVGTSRESSEKANSDYKVSNFSFYAFKDELLDRVASHPITEFDLAGLNKEAIAGPGDNPIPVKFAPAEEEGRVQVLSGDRKIAYVSQVGPQMPLSTKAVGIVQLQPAATATLSHPELSSPVKINKVSQGDFAKENLNLETAIEIRLEKPKYPALTLNGRSLGRLDKDSVETLKQVGALSEGLTFPATLQSEGTGRGKRAVVTTAKGNILKTAQQYSSYSHRTFSGERAQLSVQLIPENQVVPTAYIGNRKVGEISDKASRETLIQAGINQHGQILEGAKIESNATTAQLSLDPDTIEYPELGKWVKRNTPENESSTTPLNASQAIRQRLVQKPSLSYQTAGEMGLVVDRRRAQRTADWLRSQGIQLRIPDPQTTEAETARGYQVFLLDPEQLPEETKTTMASRTGKPLQHDGLNSQYRQELFKQTPVKKSQLNPLYPAPMAAGILEPTGEPPEAETRVKTIEETETVLETANPIHQVETALDAETDVRAENPKIELH